MATILGRLNKFFLHCASMILLTIFMSSCQELSLNSEVNDRAQCNEGEEFKTVTRKCESIVIKNAPPVANLERIALEENNEPQTIELTFNDQNEDPVLGCDITSFSDNLDGDNAYPVSCFCEEELNKCFAKIKPDTNFFSHAEFSYVVFDRDGRSNEKFVFVEISSVDDVPSVQIDDFSDDARDAVIIERGLGVDNEMSEDSTKTFEFFASDPDGDEISSCEIIETSANIDVNSECSCSPTFDNLYSTCEVSMKAKQNFYGVGEYFTYRVFSQNNKSPRLYSGLNSFFINITPLDDAPVICQLSKLTDAPECAPTERDSCVGIKTPEELNILPSSHTAKIPIVYLNETTGECFRSYKDNNGALKFIGSIRDEDIFNTGITDSATGSRVNYIYGADFISMEETTDSVLSTVTHSLSPGFDIDDLRSGISYSIIDIPDYILPKNCLGYNISGVLDGSTNQSLICTFELTEENYNDHFLTDTNVLQNNEYKLPSMRFRARQSGDLKTSSQGPVCLSLIGGNTNAQASVTVESRDVFSLSDGPYCYGGYGDEVEYSASSGNICGELGVASISFSTTTKVNVGDSLTIRVSGVEDSQTVEDKLLTFSDCGQTCLTTQINLDTASGAYKNNYSDYASTLARRALDRLRALNDGAAIEAKIDESDPNKIILRSRTLAPPEFIVNKSSTGLTYSKVMPYWIYRGDSGVGDLSCVGENGQLGNHFIISIEELKTTSKTIKTAIENHSKANELIEVFLYGSINESYKPIDIDTSGSVDPSEQWPLVLTGGRAFSDYLTYQAFSGIRVSNIGRVYFNIADINQAPEISTPDPITISGIEENTLTFSLPPATDPDILENLYYEIDQSTYETISEKGTLRGCLNLEGSDGPFDLTCEFIPNPDFNTTGGVHLTFKYKVIDSSGEEATSPSVEFNIEDENDPAFICQYDKFKDAPECGLDGCISAVTPVGRITPSSHTNERFVVFYSTDEQTCFKSNGSENPDQWEKVVGSLIRDVEINQLQKIVIDNLVIDEGGGEFENNQLLGLFSITFPDQTETEAGPNFLPVENIEIFYGDDPATAALTGFSETSPADFGDTDDLSADTKSLRFEITPVAGFSGEATVRINFGDFITNVTIPANLQQESFAEFKVKLNQVNVTHNGWKNLKVLGPRIGGSPYCEISTPITDAADYDNQKKALTRDSCDTANGIWRSGELVDSPNVCSFSETLCNSGNKCIGADHTSATADEFNAIYKNTTNGTCHVAKSHMNIGQAKVTGKKAGGIFVFVEHVDSDEISEVFSTEELGLGEYNHSSFIHLKLNPSTTYDQLGALISGDDFSDNMDCIIDGDASCLLSIDLPSLSETTSELNIESDLPQGLYYLGIKNGYTYINRGLLVVTYQSGLSVEISDNDSAPSAEYIEAEKTLKIEANLFSSTIDEVKSSINTNPTPENLQDSFKRPLFSAFIIDETSRTIEGQNKIGFSLVSNSYTWIDLVSPCSVTQSDELSKCRSIGFGGSCLIFNNPITDLGVDVGSDFNSSFYDQKNNRCYRLNTTQADKTDQTFIEYDATGSVKLEWENFTVGGSSIAGFNVYRRLGKISINTSVTSPTPDDIEFLDSEFDLTTPINTELLGSNTTSFTDDFSTSRHPPLPGTVYYYTVKPVVLGSNGEEIITNSLQSYATIRLLSPLPNYAFVHRWIVNKTMCNLMHAENRTNGLFSSDQYKISKENNFRCRYFGIGMSDSSGNEIINASEVPTDDENLYYDIGYDMLVNQAELSCPYSRRQCSFGDGEYGDLDCIGNIDPTVAGNEITPRSVNAVFYNRSTAKCYIAFGLTVNDWEELEVASSSEYNKLEHGMNNIHLPPISNISKDNANNLCAHTDDLPLAFGLVNGTSARGYISLIGTPEPKIPTRRQQRAFSLWSDDYSHEEIEILENGLSLNSTSRCNTQNANGLEEEFTSSDNPPVNSPETVTASDLASFTWRDGESKLIRSLMTGSENTKNCQSRFGVQDHVGNLSEWSDDHFYATSTSFELNEPGPGPNQNDFYNILNFSDMDGGTLLNTIGIISTDESDGIEDRNFVIDSASDIAGAMNIPLGFPIRPSAVNDLDDDRFKDFIFSIGTTSGIETDHLHSDRVYLYQDEDEDGSVDVPGGDENQILFGGGFRDGGGAGVYFMQFEDPDKDTRPDVGTRCVHVIKDEYYP